MKEKKGRLGLLFLAGKARKERRSTISKERKVGERENGGSGAFLMTGGEEERGVASDFRCGGRGGRKEEERFQSYSIPSLPNGKGRGL